jgi:ATP-binding cassette, subfamily C, bacteriocin exporter
MDCGPACINSVVNFYGGEAQISLIRQYSGTTSQGTKFAGMKSAAIKFGLQCEGYQVESPEEFFNEVKSPAILHIEKNNFLHYVIYYGEKGDKVIVGDPAVGVTTMDKNALLADWKSRTFLLMQPNEDFVKSEALRIQKQKWLIQLIQPDLPILLISSMLGIVVSVLSLTSAIFSQKLIDVIIPAYPKSTLITSFILFVLILLFRMLLNYVRNDLVIKQTSDFNNRMIALFYEYLLKLPKSFFDSHKVGELMARFNDSRRIQSFISVFFGTVIIDVLTILISLLFVFSYSTVVGGVLSSIALIYIVVIFKKMNSVNVAQREALISFASSESTLLDTLHGIADVKSSNRESVFTELNFKTYQVFQQKLYLLGRVNTTLSSVAEGNGVLIICVTLALSTVYILSGGMQIGVMVALISLAATVIPATNRISTAYIQYQESTIAFNRMFELMLVKPEVQNSSVGIPLSSADLRFNSVSFGFPNSAPLFNNVTLHAPHGKLTAIVGESGSGKSTLLQLIQKFYQPSNGVITCNDTPIQDIETATWRTHLGVVPQEVKIFNGNLYFNIALSQDESVNNQVESFCYKFGLDKWFRRFPNGYATIVGESGVNLSGGEKQIVGFARALFRKPRVLLLDEATSAMDRESENIVFDLIAKIKSNLSIVLVTHRTSVAKRCDYLYHLTEKQLIFVQTFEEWENQPTS